MSSTDKRNIEFMVRGILEKHGIDSLVIEIDLICAFDEYLKGRYKKEEPADLRVRILKALNAGTEKQNERDVMEERIKRCMGINPRTTPALWDTVIHFLIGADKKGETIERFNNACEADQFGMPKSHQIAMKPTLIPTMWAKVFREGVEKAQADTDGGYR